MSEPRLNQKVYVLTIVGEKPYCLNYSPVYMKNKEAFVTKDVLCVGIIEEARTDYWFEEEGKTWFRTLKQAKAYLKSIGYKLFKIYEDEWNVERGG